MGSGTPALPGHSACGTERGGELPLPWHLVQDSKSRLGTSPSVQPPWESPGPALKVSPCVCVGGRGALHDVVA